jgi:hypothetical protein
VTMLRKSRFMAGSHFWQAGLALGALSAA